METYIGIRHESKYASEQRTPITPYLVRKLSHNKHLRFMLQRSEKRIFSDEEYTDCGAKLCATLRVCSVIFGIKEIPMKEIEAEKTYVFFSHTHKGQTYNMPMLKRLMDKGCTLIDYERIVDERNHRLVSFGFYAGLAGMVNTIWATGQRYKHFGIKTPFLRLRQATTYGDLDEIRSVLTEIRNDIKENGLPQELFPLTLAVCGRGKVSKGAQEILSQLPLTWIKPQKLLQLDRYKDLPNNTIYTALFNEADFAVPVEEGRKFVLQDYYVNGRFYRNVFEQYLPYISVMVNGVYWDAELPRLVSKVGMKALFEQENPKLTVIGDISCDINGSIECLEKSATIEEPVHTYNPLTGEVKDGFKGNGVLMMAVDILPSELPRDASIGFAKTLSEYIEPIALADYNKPFSKLNLPDCIKRATIVHGGKLTPSYRHLQRIVDKL